MSIPEMPALAFIGQFGLYAGTASDRNIRGGIFSHKPGQYTQNLVNNGPGRDTDSHFVGLFSPGDNLRLTLRRIANKYTLTVENRTTGKATTLATRPPRFLDGERDLYVGFSGADRAATSARRSSSRSFKSPSGRCIRNRRAGRWPAFESGRPVACPTAEPA